MTYFSVSIRVLYADGPAWGNGAALRRQPAARHPGPVRPFVRRICKQNDRLILRQRTKYNTFDDLFLPN